MPHWWERKIEKYEAYKAELDEEIDAAPPGLDLAVILRLKDLKEIQSGLEENGDKRKLISNIKAIIEAYTSKKLMWNDGLVTYWSKGKMICDDPEEFTWSDFDYYSEMHHGSENFWVEGVCLYMILLRDLISGS